MGELEEAEIDEAMELADAVVEILPQPVAMADHSRGASATSPRRDVGACLFSKPNRGKRGGVDGIGLGAFEGGVLEAARERVDQRNLVSGGGQHDEQALPVVTGRLHDDEHRRGANLMHEDDPSSTLPRPSRLPPRYSSQGASR